MDLSYVLVLFVLKWTTCSLSVVGRENTVCFREISDRPSDEYDSSGFNPTPTIEEEEEEEAKHLICTRLTSELDGETAWRTCRNDFIEDYLDHGKDLYEQQLQIAPLVDNLTVWLNLRETFPSSGDFIIVEPRHEVRPKFMVEENHEDQFLKREGTSLVHRCLAFNFVSRQLFGFSCLDHHFHAVCSERTQRLNLSEKDTASQGPCFNAAVPQQKTPLTVDAFTGCFWLGEERDSCEGVAVLLRTQYPVCALSPGVDVWYNGLMSSPGDWTRAAPEEIGHKCTLCRVATKQALQNTRIPLQLRLRIGRKLKEQELVLEWGPSHWALKEPNCSVYKAKITTEEGSTRRQTRSQLEKTPPVPTITWCSQRTINGQYAISNSVMWVPTNGSSYTLTMLNRSRLLSQDNGKKVYGWTLPRERWVVAILPNNNTYAYSQEENNEGELSFGGTKLDVNAKCTPWTVYGEVREEVSLGVGTCLRRLCVATTGCQEDVPCSADACGPFALSLSLWQRLRRPLTKHMDRALAAAVGHRRHSAREEFELCARVAKCAAEAVWELSAPPHDCDGNGIINCDDRARTFMGACSKEQEKDYDRSVFFARFWSISHDTEGEPIEMLESEEDKQDKVACVHSLLFGSKWVIQTVEKDSFRIVSLGRFGGAIFNSHIDNSLGAPFHKYAVNSNKYHGRDLINFIVSKDPFMTPKDSSQFTYVDDDVLASYVFPSPLLNVNENYRMAPYKDTSSSEEEKEPDVVIDNLSKAADAAGKDAKADEAAVAQAAGVASELLAAAPGSRADAMRLSQLPALLERLTGRAMLMPGVPLVEVQQSVALAAAELDGARPARGFALAFPSTGSQLFDRGARVDVLSTAKDVPAQVQAAALLPATLPLPRGARAAFAVFADGAAFPVEGAPQGTTQKGPQAASQNGSQEAEQGGGWRLNSRVVGMSLWNSTGELIPLPPGTHVDLMLRPSLDAAADKLCVYWEPATRRWSGNGCELLPPTKDSTLDTCRCRHLSHFAQLAFPSAAGADSKPLQIISVIGCVLSLLAMVGIVGAAFCVPQWRNKPENKVLLNLCAAVTLTMVFFLGAALRPPPPGSVGCRLLGALLHYSVLASFCWMLSAAFTHYLRLATVMGPAGVRRLTLKTGLLSWGVPLLPVIILAAVSPGSYVGEPTQQGLCYPQGTAFYAVVLAPIVIVLLINLAFFVLVLHVLGLLPCWLPHYQLASASRSRDVERRIIIRKLLICVAFVFLFGLTWILGLFSASIVFAYLFCLTATLQGVVLLVFFALGERHVRARFSVMAGSLQGRLRPVTRTSASTVSSSMTFRTTPVTSSARKVVSDDDTDELQSKFSKSMPELRATRISRETHF